MHAIVLSRRDIREADQVLALYSLEAGKQELIARGIKKITSKQTALLEPFCAIEYEVVFGKEMRYLVKAQLLESFSGIRKTLAPLLMAGTAVAAFERLVPSEEPDETLYRLLFSWLLFVNTVAQPKIFLLYALLSQTFSRIGYQPRLENCSRCSKGKKELLTEKFLFSPPDGGLMCEACARLDNRAAGWIRVGLSDVSDLELLFSAPWHLIQSLERGEKEQERLGEILSAFAAYHAPRLLPDLKKVAFLLKNA